MKGVPRRLGAHDGNGAMARGDGRRALAAAADETHRDARGRGARGRGVADGSTQPHPP